MLAIGPQWGFYRGLAINIVGASCLDFAYRVMAGYITPSHTTHPRAHNVRSYGLYRIKITIFINALPRQSSSN